MVEFLIDMCGHSVMGVTTALIEMGMVTAKESETKIIFDTPAGVVESDARVAGNRVLEVTLTNVPSFLYQRVVDIEVPNLGTIPIDLAFGGNFFALVSAERLGVSVHPDHYAQLIHLGMVIKEAVNRTLQVQHPTKPAIRTV